MKNSITNVMLSAREYFDEMVRRAIETRRVSTTPLAANYLVELLNSYVSSPNLLEKPDEENSGRSQTLAEMWLVANSAEAPLKLDLLKKIGDTTLYISGFFGDSLNRKLVDVDYYAELGGSAYGSLAHCVSEKAYASVYEEFSHRFLEFVDVLTYISQKALVQTNEDLLRLYERYVTTGSPLAREQLLEKGLITTPGLKKTDIKQ